MFYLGRKRLLGSGVLVWLVGVAYLFGGISCGRG